ncbi:MAG: NUDIX hydrolase [Bacillaceae bacterium]|nr:NUDIX hydrolase [Bacillaceae bacterium]
MSFTITSGAVVINIENKILLKKDPKRGWELPGGHVEKEETVENAVIREVKEETGIDIRVEKFCGVSQEVKRGICHMWWLASPVGGEIRTCTESIEVNYFSLEEALHLIENEVFKQELLLCICKSNIPFFVSY